MPADPDVTPPATILVVDDNEMNRDMLSRRLERKGFSVRAAADGAGALQAVAQGGIDLVLLDIEMPGLSGMDVLRTLRRTYTSLDLPIVMATARTDSQDVVQALEDGANDYVTKPLDFPVVLARVEAQLRTRARAAQGRLPSALSDAEAGPGRVLAGKYRLEALIGAGAFGSVYRAQHVDLGREVALKVLQTAAARSPDGLKRFQREGIAACRIAHPNAVAVTDFGVTEAGTAFLVMELLAGHVLEDEIRRAGRLSPLRTAEVLDPLCSVLEEAHRAGIVHRDVKPANVFLHRGPRGEVVKVLDFGIAKLLDEDARSGHLTVDGGIIGTPAYMAPERFRGVTPTGATDVYSVGVMLYQMLSGRLPFDSSDSDLVAIAMMHLNREPAPLRALAPDVSLEVEQVVMSALRKDPAQRPAAAALALAFAHALGADAGLAAMEAGAAAIEPPAPRPLDPLTVAEEITIDDPAGVPRAERKTLVAPKRSQLATQAGPTLAARPGAVPTLRAARPPRSRRRS